MKLEYMMSMRRTEEFKDKESAIMRSLGIWCWKATSRMIIRVAVPRGA